MKSKSGTTLIEAIISIVVVSVVIVTLLQALSIGVYGTLDINRQTSALNLAKSQLEHINSQTYNTNVSQGGGSLSDAYGLITVSGSDIKDKLNYNISGQVEYVNGSSSLQKVTVNVSYLHSKSVQLIGYKDSGGDLIINAPYRDMLATDTIEGMPILYSGSGGAFVGCNEMFKGYYHIFNTSGSLYGRDGRVSINWNFYWTRWDPGITSMGAPIVAIYPGIPAWATGSEADPTSGTISRQQDRWQITPEICTALGIPPAKCIIGSIGDLPGPGDFTPNCDCQCHGNCTGEANPVWWMPHDCLGAYDKYPCSGGCGALGCLEDEYWMYDGGACTLPDTGLCGIHWCNWCGCDSGTLDRTMVTDPLTAGTYTILFFNSENKINIESISPPSVTYWK